MKQSSINRSQAENEKALTSLDVRKKGQWGKKLNGSQEKWKHEVYQNQSTKIQKNSRKTKSIDAAVLCKHVLRVVLASNRLSSRFAFSRAIVPRRSLLDFPVVPNRLLFTVRSFFDFPAIPNGLLFTVRFLFSFPVVPNFI